MVDWKVLPVAHACGELLNPNAQTLNPKPAPAFDTAATNLGSEIQLMPGRMTGCWMPRSFCEAKERRRRKGNKALQDHGVPDAEQLLTRPWTGALKKVERATRIMVRSGWQKWLTVMRVEMPRAAMVAPRRRGANGNGRKCEFLFFRKKKVGNNGGDKEW